jgi:hypothetical protein
MSFRDQAIADLPTFLNVDEFGDTVDIDGVAMACVLVNDEVPTNMDGVTTLESTLYVRAADFIEAPVVRQRMTIGSRQANVIRVDEEQAMLVIRLSWYDS